jgi:hypothetical protein
MYASVCREQHIVDQLPEKRRRYVGLAHEDCEARKERVCTWLVEGGVEWGGGVGKENLSHRIRSKNMRMRCLKLSAQRTLPA